MNNVLDLKKKRVQERENDEPELYHSPLKKVEEKLQERRPSNSPVPIMVTWTGPLFHHSPNVRLLTISLSVLYATGVFFIFFQRNIFAAIFFLLAATMLWISSAKAPPEVEFVVGPLSVKEGPREFQFSEIKSFWVEYNPGGIKELSLQLKKWYLPFIKLPLMDQDPVQITSILLKFVPEIEHQDSIIDSFIRILGV